MRIPWKNALIAGIVGTFLFDLTGFMAMSLMGNPTWWDIPALLADKLGLPLVAGVFAHYLNGFVIAVLYAAVAPSLRGSKWARALLFMTAETIIGVWFFMAPLLGMGIAGWGAMGPMFAILSLMRHWAYGAALAYFLGTGQSAPATRTAVSAA